MIITISLIIITLTQKIQEDEYINHQKLPVPYNDDDICAYICKRNSNA